MKPTKPTHGRVLIVEDDAPCRAALHQLLRHQGYTARSVGTIRDALEALPWAQCVLLDWMLHDGCGIEVLRAARLLNPRPVIAVTSASDDLTLALSGARDADSLIPKPLNFKALTRWLTRVLPPAPGVDQQVA